MFPEPPPSRLSSAKNRQRDQSQVQLSRAVESAAAAEPDNGNGKQEERVAERIEGAAAALASAGSPFLHFALLFPTPPCEKDRRKKEQKTQDQDRIEKLLA